MGLLDIFGLRPSRWGEQTSDEEPPSRRPSYRTAWTLVALVIFLLFVGSAAWCETPRFATEDCSTAQGRKAGITFIVWLIGFFLISVIEASSRRDQGDGIIASRADPIEDVRRLGQLRDDGLISEEEFQRKKEQLLRRIE